jgi:DNA-binding MarR family transcriptional regulator
MSHAPLPLPPALALLQTVWRLNHAIERASSRMEARLGVTAQQRFVLRCVGRFPGITAGQLASLLLVDRGTVSAALNRLERKGLLTRQADPRDRRRVALGLTPRGHALDRPQDGTVEDAAARALASLPPEVMRAAEEALATLAARVDEV